MYGPRHLCRPARTSNGSRLPLCYSTPSISVQRQLKEYKRELKLQTLLIPFCSNIVSEQARSTKAPPTSTFLPLHLTVPKRFGASVLVSDTTIQLQRSFVYVRNGSKNFWWHEGDLNNSRQVLLMLWLWILYSCLLYMHVVANCKCPWQHFFFLNQFIICSIAI